MAVTSEPSERMDLWESMRHADTMGDCVRCIEIEEILIMLGVYITISIKGRTLNKTPTDFLSELFLRAA